MTRTALIVGDCFATCCLIDNVDTVSGFAKKIRAVASGMIAPDELPGEVIWGQGVGEHERTYISRLASGLDESVAPKFIGQIATPATRGHVHKRAPQNVLISVPERENDQRFVSDLIIDSRNELLIDHVTGQHVQGMVLVEACRQMFLAVTEEHFLGEKAPAETYFVIKSMGVEFKSFVFPVGAQVVFSLGRLTHKEGGRLAADAAISIWQNNAECVTCSVSYSVFDASQLAARELELAREAARRSMGNGSTRVAENAEPDFAPIDLPIAAISVPRDGAAQDLRVGA